MWSRKELRAHLRKKLNIGDRRLSQIVAAKALELPSTNEEALHVVAWENGLNLQNYLTREQIAATRDLVVGRPAAVTPVPTKANGARAPRKGTPKTVSVTIAGVKVGDLPGLKPSHAKDAKAMAERVYPLLYLIENSVRDVIELVLADKHGANWWDTAVPQKTRDEVADLKEQEKKDTWHGKRGRRDIDYPLLTSLWKIIKHRWKDFEDLFPQGQAWVQSMIEHDLNVSRRPIAHMNALEENDIKNLEAAFRKWTKHLTVVKNKLPTAQ